MRRDQFFNRPHDYTRAPRTSSRHQLGWKELNDTDDQLAVSRAIFGGCLLGLATWALIALAVVGAVTLLDRL